MCDWILEDKGEEITFCLLLDLNYNDERKKKNHGRNYLRKNGLESDLWMITNNEEIALASLNDGWKKLKVAETALVPSWLGKISATSYSPQCENLYLFAETCPRYITALIPSLPTPTSLSQSRRAQQGSWSRINK